MRFRLVTEASAAAMEIERLMVAHSRNLPATVAQDMFDNYMRFSAMAYRAGMIGTPKTHLMIHCFQQARRKGNPRLYSCYRDESLNGLVSRVASSVHQSVFAVSVLKKIHISERICIQKAAHKSMERHG